NDLFGRHNHNDKLTLLTYLANCLHKTNQFKKSLEVAEQLHHAMKEYEGFLYDKYIFYYYNVLVLNYAKEDKEKALETLQLAKNNEIIKKLPGYTSFIYLNTGLIYYYQEKYNSAKTNISRLIQQEDFLSLDVVFQFKILIVELIIRLKLDQHELILEKIDEIKSNYKVLISNKKLSRDNKALACIQQLAEGQNLDKNTLISFFENSHEEDIIDYSKWVTKI
ncbi:MAG: hypothetical protein ACPH67_04950, partial [Flavobacteriales bacterium]